MHARLAAMAPLLLLLQVGSVSAADCNQERAIYGDRQGLYELAFEPVDAESSASSHSFKMTVKNSTLVLDGYVMPSEPVNRSNGYLFNHCPDGDITGDDIAACTVWQGIVYANDNGRIDLLPQQGSPAARAILLAGFGPALAASSAWGPGKATVAPWDLLSLKGCRP